MKKNIRNLRARDLSMFTLVVIMLACGFREVEGERRKSGVAGTSTKAMVGSVYNQSSVNNQNGIGGNRASILNDGDLTKFIFDISYIEPKISPILKSILSDQEITDLQKSKP